MKTLIKTTLLAALVLLSYSCSKDDTVTPQEETNSTPEISNQSFEVAENISAATIIGNVVATDADAGDTLVFSITTSTNTLFEITDAGAISLIENQNLDFETSQTHSITVSVTDGTESASGIITITVTDIDENSTPTITDQTFTVAENITDATTIGTVEANDPDGNTLSFSIVTNDTDLFEITTAGELRLATGKILDFETSQTHSITVSVTDGTESASAVITITVTDVNENTAPQVNNQVFTVSEVIVDTQIVGNITATDAENDTLTYSIVTNSNPLFEITEAGALSLAQGQRFNFDNATSHTITVGVSDGNASSEATVTINVTDIPETAFITTWETTGSGEILTIPTRTAELLYSYTIDWGDGNVDESVRGDVSHVYQTIGIHTISISGFAFPAISLKLNENSQKQLRSIEHWGTIEWSTMEGAFTGTDLVINTNEAPNLNRVTSMSSMFQDSKFNQDISTWDVSRVTDMEFAFRRSDFNQDISTWDVSRVTNMRGMFSDTEFNQDISTWDVSRVTDMSFMFSNSKFNQDISTWNISNVTDTRAMFQLAEFNQNIGNWDVSNVTNMGFMFNNSKFNKDIGNWDVSNVTRMEFMFPSTNFNQDISDWDVSAVRDMDGMFNNSTFNRDISSWNVSSVTSMQTMFRGSQFDSAISKWDVSRVTNMSSMFENAIFSQDIADWDVSNVANMEAMFKGAIFKSDISSWNANAVTNCSEFADKSVLPTELWPEFSNCTP